MKDSYSDKFVESLKTGIEIPYNKGIGYKFWSDMGYVEMERFKKACGNKEHIAIGMEVIL